MKVADVSSATIAPSYVMFAVDFMSLEKKF